MCDMPGLRRHDLSKYCPRSSYVVKMAGSQSAAHCACSVLRATDKSALMLFRDWYITYVYLSAGNPYSQSLCEILW